MSTELIVDARGLHKHAVHAHAAHAEVLQRDVGVGALAQTREQLRQAFLCSAEFVARVNAVVAQGCLSP